MDFATDISVIGQWWLPGKEEKYHGELTYKKNEGITLHIFGAFNGVSGCLYFLITFYSPSQICAANN